MYCEQTLLGANAPLDQTLRTAGFSTKFADVFASATTEVVSSENGRYHLVQRMPALKLQRDVRITTHTGQRVTPGTNAAVRSASIRRSPGAALAIAGRNACTI